MNAPAPAITLQAAPLAIVAANTPAHSHASSWVGCSRIGPMSAMVSGLRGAIALGHPEVTSARASRSEGAVRMASSQSAITTDRKDKAASQSVPPAQCTGCCQTPGFQQP